jgi:hypothetical protein
MSLQQPLQPARRRLVVPASPDASRHAPLPRFLRAPYVALLWALTLLAVVAGTALARVRVPRVATGVAVAVRSDSDSLALVLLLPASARRYLAAGQHATIDTGGEHGLTLTVESVEHALLDAPTARRRFREPASILTHLDRPRVVARLSPCAEGECLTLTPGASYPAMAVLGTRSLASYAMPQS